MSKRLTHANIFLKKDLTTVLVMVEYELEFQFQIYKVNKEQ